MTNYRCEESDSGFVCKKREIRQPLIVEAEHWNRMVEFVKWITKAYDDDRGYAFLKEIGEIE